MAKGDVNKVELCGYVGRDPQVITFNNGGEVVRFSVATSRSYKDKTTDEWKENTTWHNVSVKNNPDFIAEAKSIKKGNRVQLSGSFESREYQKDGITQTALEVIVAGRDDTIMNQGSQRDAAPADDDTDAPF